MTGSTKFAGPLLGLWLLTGSLAGIAGPSSAATAADLGRIEPAAAAHGRDGWVLLDARPRARWEAGHLPGARSFSWEEYTRTDVEGIPYRRLPPAELAAALARLGVTERTPVIVYGDADTSWGGEGWVCWVLAWLGHQGPIRLLSGGLQAWQAAGLPLEQGPAPATPAAHYLADLRPELDISTQALARDTAGLTVIDVRSTWEWLKGRIPGAIHIPWDTFYQGDHRTPLAPEAARALLEEREVATGRPIVFYCTGGVRSAYAWLVARLAGLDGAANYEGGLEAWSRRLGK